MNKRTILIASMGTSPAVLTETVWALAHQKKPIVPDEIVVLTAMSGKERLCDELLSGENPVWGEMLSVLKKEKIKTDGKLLFGDASIHIIPDAQGNGARDLRSVEDNLRAADFMLREIRQYTEASDTVVLASIAGGRKTMSALLFSCMSLLGREDDKVFHILLPNEFEGGVEPPMYYPKKGVTYTNKLTGKSTRAINSTANSSRYRLCVCAAGIRRSSRSFHPHIERSFPKSRPSLRLQLSTRTLRSMRGTDGCVLMGLRFMSGRLSLRRYWYWQAEFQIWVKCINGFID